MHSPLKESDAFLSGKRRTYRCSHRSPRPFLQVLTWGLDPSTGETTAPAERGELQGGTARAGEGMERPRARTPAGPPLESGQRVPAEVGWARSPAPGPSAGLPLAAREEGAGGEGPRGALAPSGGRSPAPGKGTARPRAPPPGTPSASPATRRVPGRGRGRRRRRQGGGSGTAAADRMGRVWPRVPAAGAGGRRCPGPSLGSTQGGTGMPGPQAPLRGSRARGAGSGRPHARRPRPGPPGARLPRPRRSPHRPGCQAECVCALRGLRPSSDPRKGKRRLGPAAAVGPPGWGSRSCRWTNRQSTFASSRAGRESEREKEARWRLASPYVLRHAAAYVRQAPQDRPPARRRRVT